MVILYNQSKLKNTLNFQTQQSRSQDFGHLVQNNKFVKRLIYRQMINLKFFVCFLTFKNITQQIMILDVYNLSSVLYLTPVVPRQNEGFLMYLVSFLSQTLVLTLQLLSQMSKKKILQVDYKQKHGLILGWRYTDLTSHLTFFRHILVLFTDSKQNANRFLKRYLKRLRPGDLYTILYYNSEYKLKQKSWKQKMVNDQNNNYQSILTKQIVLGNKQGMLAKVQQQFNEYSQPVVVNILMDDISQKEWFQQHIKKQRANEKYDFMVGIFGPFKTASLTFSNEAACIPFFPKDDPETIQFYLNHVYQSAVIWSRITIQCRNGSINSTSQTNWKNINFNTIERFYRGPSIKYDKDFLLFYGYKLRELKYNLLIRLTFVTLQRRKYVSEKQFSVHSLGGFHQKTFSITNWIKPFHAYGDVWLQENPFRTLTIIKFDPQQN